MTHTTFPGSQSSFLHRLIQQICLGFPPTPEVEGGAQGQGARPCSTPQPPPPGRGPGMEKAVKYLLGYTWVPSPLPSQWVWKLQEESHPMGVSGRPESRVPYNHTHKHTQTQGVRHLRDSRLQTKMWQKWPQACRKELRALSFPPVTQQSL